LLDEQTGPAAQILVHLGITRSSIEELLLHMRTDRPPS
jgi:hypothetical protein